LLRAECCAQGLRIVIVVKNAVSLSACRLAADLASLLLFTLISRELGPAATGQYSYAFALGVFISIIAANGLDQYGVRRYAQMHAHGDKRSAWAAILVVQGAQLLSGIALLAVAMLFLTRKNADPAVIIELSIYMIAWALSRTFFIPATAKEEMVVPALLELACRGGASLAALVLCLVGDRSLPSILMPFPIAGLLLVALAVRNARQHGATFTWTLPWAEIRSTIRSAVPFTACEALGQFYMRADLLLITQMLGNASAGWYAADLKMVEVGLMPLVLLGTAAYPLLSRIVGGQLEGLPRVSDEFLRVVLFCSGWLAVGMYCLIPMVIPALFGNRFEPAVGLLPLFSMLALSKGLEIGLYRLLYATGRQHVYLRALMLGTFCIVALNIWLIPRYGMSGAIAAVVASSVLVDGLAIVSLRSDLRPSVFASALLRVGLPLAATAIVFTVLDATSLNDWYVALAACVAYPVFALLCGLVPHPRRSRLLA
jgi:O-antigen/teichoic acid export membrane protein